LRSPFIPSPFSSPARQRPRPGQILQDSDIHRAIFSPKVLDAVDGLDLTRAIGVADVASLDGYVGKPSGSPRLSHPAGWPEWYSGDTNTANFYEGDRHADLSVTLTSRLFLAFGRRACHGAHGPSSLSPQQEFRPRAVRHLAGRERLNRTARVAVQSGSDVLRVLALKTDGFSAHTPDSFERRISDVSEVSDITRTPLTSRQEWLR